MRMAGKGDKRRDGEDANAFSDGYECINWDSKRKGDKEGAE
jgi:hypothetical protein